MHIGWQIRFNSLIQLYLTGVFCIIDLDIYSKGCCCVMNQCCNSCAKNYVDDGCIALTKNLNLNHIFQPHTFPPLLRYLPKASFFLHEEVLWKRRRHAIEMQGPLWIKRLAVLSIMPGTLHWKWYSFIYFKSLSVVFWLIK